MSRLRFLIHVGDCIAKHVDSMSTTTLLEEGIHKFHVSLFIHKVGLRVVSKSVIVLKDFNNQCICFVFWVKGLQSMLGVFLRSLYPF